MRLLLATLYRLSAPYWRSRAGRLGWAYLAALLALAVAGIVINVRLLDWNADFYDALERLDAAEMGRQVAVFALVIAVYALQTIGFDYLEKRLQMHWRGHLTGQLLDRWLGGKAFWHLGLAPSEARPDNPDQRIAEDCNIFVLRMLRLLLGAFEDVVGLFTFLALLWSLSPPLEIVLFGKPLAVGHYLVWAAFLYVAVSSFAAHLLGRPLKALEMERQRREADFRFALVRVRENAGAIALLGGEQAERRVLERRFSAILDNWRRLIRREFLLGSFTRPYMHSTMQVPLFIALPGYIAGALTLGGLMQVRGAFQRVVWNLSGFILYYQRFAELQATAERLSRFLDRTAERQDAPAAGGITHRLSADGRVRLVGLLLRDPAGRPLLGPLDLTLRPGETVLLTGPSGQGKTTLLRTLAGLWTHGEGAVEVPSASVAFLPQHPYLPLLPLSESLAYPDLARCPTASEASARLAMAGLPPLDPAGEPAEQSLSVGERQRLVLLRLLASRPDWVFLDEATSALDPQRESEMLRLLRSALPATTFVVVAHRPPQGLEVDRHLDLSGLLSTAPAL